LYDWYWKIKKEFLAKVFTKDELTITQRVNKDANSYKSVPLHARLAKVYKEKTGEYLKGGEVDYIVTEGFGKLEGVLV